jgi:hypothetical protein
LRRVAVVLSFALALAAVEAQAGAATVTRAGKAKWRVAVTGPAQSDFTLARAEFRLPRRDVRRGPQLHTTPGPSGLDAVIVARLSLAPRGRMVVFTLVVNRRPAGSLAPDLASVPVTMTGRRLGRAPALSELVNVRAAGVSPPVPRTGVCRDGERPAASFIVHAQAGPAFDYPPDQALVQALNAACGRLVDPAFTAAILR